MKLFIVRSYAGRQQLKRKKLERTEKESSRGRVIQRLSIGGGFPLADLPGNVKDVGKKKKTENKKTQRQWRCQKA